MRPHHLSERSPHLPIPRSRSSPRKVSIMIIPRHDPHGEKCTTVRATTRPTRQNDRHLSGRRRAVHREASHQSRSNFSPPLGCRTIRPSLEAPRRGDRHHSSSGSTHRQSGNMKVKNSVPATSRGGCEYQLSRAPALMKGFQPFLVGRASCSPKRGPTKKARRGRSAPG
jgi:hypothetical protein